ncbi:MAG: hypothetical protein ABWY20_14425 [Mycobacterium sp.]
MLRRVLTTLVATVLLGTGMGTVTAHAGAGTQPWRVSTRCTQHGVLKVRFDHDLNQNGVERISSDFYAFTATGFQTWDWKTQINGVVFQKGASTTDTSGDLRLGVNRAEAGAPVVSSIAVDATNRTTGERCRLTVAVPPVGQPNAVDLEPWDAQGICSQGTPWRLRVEHHMRPNGQEKFAIGVRIVDGENEQWWSSRTTVNGQLRATGSGNTADGVTNAGVALIWKPGMEPLNVQTAGVWARKRDTGELCKVDVTVPPLA